MRRNSYKMSQLQRDTQNQDSLFCVDVIGLKNLRSLNISKKSISCIFPRIFHISSIPLLFYVEKPNLFNLYSNTFVKKFDKQVWKRRAQDRLTVGTHVLCVCMCVWVSRDLELIELAERTRDSENLIEKHVGFRIWILLLISSSHSFSLPLFISQINNSSLWILMNLKGRDRNMEGESQVRGNEKKKIKW